MGLEKLEVFKKIITTYSSNVILVELLNTYPTTLIKEKIVKISAIEIIAYNIDTYPVK